MRHMLSLFILLYSLGAFSGGVINCTPSSFAYAKGSVCNDENIVTSGWIPKLLEEYSDFNGGVIRTTTSKIEGDGVPDSPKIYGFIYLPIEKGKTYRIIANGANVYSPTWGVLAFSPKKPECGDIVNIVKSFDSEGYKNFDILYTPREDGYLMASYFHSEGFDGTYSIYKFIEQNTENENSTDVNSYSTVFEGLAKADNTFRVGNVQFNKKSIDATPFTPNAFEEQYESQYAKYTNDSDIKYYDKMVVNSIINMFDSSLDASNYKNSYCRQIIGVDSEGWSYIAQRLCMYDFETDDKTKILRTKDFEHYDVFMEGVVGVQLIELENGELCFAANSTDTYDGITGYYCNIYVTGNQKRTINKVFHTTRKANGNIGQPWSWGIQARGSVIVIGEYGSHGNATPMTQSESGWCGCAWYSRDYGRHFCKVFDHKDYAPDYPNAHIHGVCYDPYFDRMYIITGDSKRNSRLYWWDYDGENLTDELCNTIKWKYIETNRDRYTGSNFQFVCGYALKDCIILGSDGQRGGFMRINRGKKEDEPIIDYGVDFGLAKNGQFSTVWCAGNMFKRNEESPLLMCIHREASNDLEFDDVKNPSHYANTYRTVLSKVYATNNGYDFSLIWEDDTYGQYDVWTSEDMTKSVKKNLAKCGRDMSIYQLPDNTLLLKYIGRSYSYISRNNNGKTDNTISAYHRFNNYIVKGLLNELNSDPTTSMSNIQVDKKIENANMYNLQGQKMTIPYKGIYILNGKKYIR